MANQLSRRAFLQGGLGLAATAGLVGRATGRVRAGERITIGFIGAGGIANAHLGPLLAQPDVRIVGICDVNGQRRDAMVQAVNQRYGDQGCRGYRDFRELLAHADLDAVLLATPDHWHALLTIAAAKAGKHIYSEKPLSRTVAEGQAMIQAVRSHNVVFQHGTQQRSDPRFRFACELVRNGRIGKVHTVRVAVPGGVQGARGNLQAVPDWLDWDLWLGPAPWAPFSLDRLYSGCWYHTEDYSAGGFISGWGIHHVDIAQWGLGTELTGPVQIAGTATFPTDGICDAPLTWHVEYDFGTGPQVIFTTPDENRFGVTFEGSDGTIFVNRGELESSPASLAAERIGPDEVHLYPSTNHHRNWLDCIRTGGETAAPIEVGHRSQTICALSNIAVRLGRKLRWDAEHERCLNDDSANHLLARAMRSPWRL